MGSKTITFCDMCGTEKGVTTHRVVYGSEACAAGGRSEDVEVRSDLCPKCASSIDWVVSAIERGVGKGTSPGVIAWATLLHAVIEGPFKAPRLRGGE